MENKPGNTDQNTGRRISTGKMSNKNLGISLVSVPLSGTNYKNWREVIIIVLAAKQKLGLVGGRIKQSTESSAEYDEWCGDNAMVLSWLLNSLSKEFHETFIYTKSASEL